MGKGNNSSFNCEDWLSGMLEALAERVSELVMQKMASHEARGTSGQADESATEEGYLPKKEVMEKFGVSASTLWHWSKDGYLVPSKLGNKVLYRKSDIEDMLRRKRKG